MALDDELAGAASALGTVAIVLAAVVQARQQANSPKPD